MAPVFPLPSDTASTTLLLATLDSLSTPHFLAPVIHTATSLTKDRLIIVLFSRFFNLARDGLTYPESLAITHTATSSWKDVQSLLTYVYVQATKTAQEMDNVLLSVDVLLEGLNDSELQGDLDGIVKDLGVEMVFRVSGDSIATPLPESIGALRTAYLPTGDSVPDSHFAKGSYAHLTRTPSQPLSPTLPCASNLSQNDVISSASIPPLYPVAALGGTFDHLHAGHKILLSMGAWIASTKLIVGVTSASFLSKKPNAHLVEPLETRMKRIREFLHLFKKGLQLDIVELMDVYGPTGWDPNVQALVVSRETISGAKESKSSAFCSFRCVLTFGTVAAYREQKKLPPLDLYVIDVISATNHNLDHEDASWLRDMKLSSTFIREWIANRDGKLKAGEEGSDPKN